MTTARRFRVLHVANWYPNPWDDVEGNFVKAQFDLFRQVTAARLVHVQVRQEGRAWLRMRCVELGDGATGHYLLTRFRRPRVQEFLTTALLLLVLVRMRAWRFDLLHFHIAWPLLAHAHLWRRLFRRPAVISEHWSAYHDGFYLPEGSPAHRRMQRPFRLGMPVIAVSRALLDDIRNFVRPSPVQGYVIPNVVPLYGYTPRNREIPVLFAVNRWRPIKNPATLIDGLARAADRGARFQLVIGGFGDALEEMKQQVECSALAERTRFLGKMSRQEVAAQLARSDGYVFSSRYETFSVACAEALAAGVPLIGPRLSAIAEYAGPDDWEYVMAGDPESWAEAVTRFLERLSSEGFDRSAIARRAADRFAPQAIQQNYLRVIGTVMGGGVQPVPGGGCTAP